MGKSFSIFSSITLKFRYSGLKSCPHSDIQCASSIARKDRFTVFKNSMVSSLTKDSGATYKSFVTPLTMSNLTCCIAVLVRDEFSTCAIPYSEEIPRIAST